MYPFPYVLPDETCLLSWDDLLRYIADKCDAEVAICLDHCDRDRQQRLNKACAELREVKDELEEAETELEALNDELETVKEHNAALTEELKELRKNKEEN